MFDHLFPPKTSHNWLEIATKLGRSAQKVYVHGAGRRSEKQEAKYSRVARWCAPSNCLARPMPSSKVTWESNPLTGPNCETSSPRRRLGGVRLAPLPHNQPGVVCGGGGGGGDGGVRRFWGLMENWQGDETYLASCAISISANSGIRFIPLVHHFNYRILGDLAFNPESCKSICLASISVRFLNLPLPPIVSGWGANMTPLSHKRTKKNGSNRVKGIVHNFVFYRSNLIFWIVMGCGIADFGRRGL